MDRANFTAERVANFECKRDKQQSIYWDGKTPGLGVRVTANGAKSYIFESRLHGKTLRLTIGNVRTWTIAKAQAEATRFKTLTDQGNDPRILAAAQRAKSDAARAEDKRQGLTLADVWPVYLEARKSLWSPRYYLDHVRFASLGGQRKKRGEGVKVAGPLAPLMPVSLSELTGTTVATWLKKEKASRPTVAATAFRILRSFVGWAADVPEYRGIIPPDACNARAVRDAVPKSRAKEGDSLQREQLPGWFAAVRKLQNPVISVGARLNLTSSAR